MSKLRRVLLVDDHPLFRWGLQKALADGEEFEIAAEAATIAEAQTVAAGSDFDLAVVDISLPDGSGLDLVSWLTGRLPNLPVVVMSMHESAEFVRAAIRRGARGYVTKGAPASEITAALHVVVDGGVFVEHDVSQLLVSEGPKAGSQDELQDKLTPRELEVADHLSRGLTAAEVADELGISVKTVEAHRGSVYRKLDVRNVAELTRLVAELPASLGVSP